jgi:small subunit ribosomal protein S6
MTAANKLRTYETICLTKVDMPEEKYNALVERCKSAVTSEGKGQWLFSDEWGRAKIAFTIGKDNRARWSYFRYKCAPEGVNEVRRGLGINEFVLRFSTVRADDEGKDYDPIRQNMAQDLQDREKTRDAWREERASRRGGPGGDRGGGRYRDQDDRNTDALPGSVVGDDDMEDGAEA